MSFRRSRLLGIAYSCFDSFSGLAMFVFLCCYDSRGLLLLFLCLLLRCRLLTNSSICFLLSVIIGNAVAIQVILNLAEPFFLHFLLVGLLLLTKRIYLLNTAWFPLTKQVVKTMLNSRLILRVKFD